MSINAGSVSVEVVPDARLFAEKLRAKIGNLTTQVTANADTADAEARLDEVARNRTVKVDADTRGAERNISNLTAAVVGLGPALVPVTAAVGGLAAAFAAPIAAAGGGLTVYGILTGAAVKKTEEQKKQIQELAKGVQSARDALANANASAATSQANSVASAQRSAALSAMSAQQSAQKSIASAKQSLDASLASAQKAMQSATTAAGRAAAQQRIDAAKTAYQQRIAAAQQSLSDRKALISKGLENSQASSAASATASQAAAQRKVNEAVQKYRAALQELTPAQRQFLNAQDDLKTAFGDLIKHIGPSLLGPLTQGMRDLIQLMPSVSPLIRDVSGGISTLLDAVDTSARSGSLARFGDFIKTWADYSIVSFGRSLGNIGSGIAGIVQASAPLSGSVLDGLERMTGTFAKWGQNAGNNNFQDFLAYARKEGPQAAQTLGDIAGAFGAIAKDAAPVGGVVLKGLDAFAKILHRIADSKAGPTLFASAAGLVALHKAWKLGSGLKGGITSASSRIAKLLGREGVAGAETIAGKALGKGVVPVYVTNKGFGPPEGVPKGEGIPEPVKVGGSVAAGLSITAAFATLGAGAIYGGSRFLANKGGFSNEQYARDYQRTHGGNLPDPNSTRGFRDFGNGRTNIPAKYQDADLRAQVAARTAQLLGAQQRKDFLANKEAAAQYAQQLGKIPQRVRTQVWLSNADQSARQIRDYAAQLSALNGKVAKTFIQQVVRQPVAGGGHPILTRGSGAASGATVPGPRFPYGDKILMPVAPGEEIVSNRHGQADKWRPLLKAISSGGMAGGGTVGGSRGVALQQEIRGTLSLDRNGVAYIHGVARDTVDAGNAHEQQARRTAALGVLP